MPSPASRFRCCLRALQSTSSNFPELGLPLPLALLATLVAKTSTVLPKISSVVTKLFSVGAQFRAPSLRRIFVAAFDCLNQLSSVVSNARLISTDLGLVATDFLPLIHYIAPLLTDDGAVGLGLGERIGC
jgi:hypothetical protein